MSPLDFLSLFSPLDYLLWACTAYTFVLAWTAFRKQRSTDKQASRVSLLWAVGLGVRLVFPLASYATYVLHDGRAQLSNKLGDNLSFICLLAGIVLTIQRPRTQALAEQDAA